MSPGSMSQQARRAMLPPLLGALLGGAGVGLLESLHLLSQSYGTRDYSGMVQGVLLYSAVGLLVGFVLGAAAGLLTILFRAPPEPARAYATGWIVMFCGGGAVVARYVLVRDVLGGAPLESGPAAGLALAFLLSATTSYLLGRNALKKTFFAFLLHPLGSGAVWAGLVGFTLLFAVGTMLNNRAGEDVPPRPIAPTLRGQPNVLLIAVDGLRADVLQGDTLAQRAPNLARLARESTRFHRASTQGVSTRSAFASLLGSRAACAHGAVGPTSALSDGVETISEVLSAQGFTTGAIVTSVDTARSFNFDQGYDTFEFLRPRWPLRASEASVRLALYEQILRWWDRLDPSPPASRSHRSALDVSAAAADWLRRHGAERWFLTLQYQDLAPLRPRRAQAGAMGDGPSSAEPHPDVRAGRRTSYQIALAELDRGLGALWEYLDAHDLFDVTAVVLVGLRGMEIDEGRGTKLGARLREERLQVPVLVRPPGGDGGAGRDSDDLVRLVDVAPTVAELVGAPEGQGWQGVSLLREYALRAPTDRLALAEARKGRELVRALRDGPWKLVRASRPRRQPVHELFFLDDDPEEREDLSRSPQASWKLAEELAQLDALELALCAPPLGGPRAQRTRETTPLSSDECAVLRRLGYPEASSARCRGK